MSRGDNESAPKLYIEFEDDELAAVTGEAELVSGREAVGNGGSGLDGFTPRWRPDWRWGALPRRYRKVVAAVVALAGLAAAVGNSLVAQAGQRAADRSAVSVMDAAYSPSADGDGLDLLIDVADNGGGTVTLTQAQVRQADLSMDYLGAPVDLSAHQQLEIVLWGQYDCSLSGSAGSGAGPGAGAQVATVRVTVHNSQGDVNTLTLPLPATAQVPAPWRGGRAAFCMWAWGAEP